MLFLTLQSPKGINIHFFVFLHCFDYAQIDGS